MIKRFLLICSLLLISINIFSQSNVAEIISSDEPIANTIINLKKIAQDGETNQDKFEAALVLAQIQEQFGEYTDASYYYTTAAGLIGTQTAKGQELLLGAVRCALLVGDVSRADFLLSTALTSITDVNAKARANLYAVWSWIIKSETEEELAGPITVLQSYVVLESMEIVKPSLLLTLYHLTEEEKWANELINTFPDSPETAIVQGNAHMYPSPFWFFSSMKGSVNE